MTVRDRATLKTYFEAGDTPTETQFGDWFDSIIVTSDDCGTNVTTALAAATNAANGLVQLDSSGDLPALDGSALTGISAGSVEGTAVLSTGEAGGTKFLREDGDGTSSWQTPAGAGNVSTTGTPLDNQIAIWTDATTVEGDAALTFDAASDTLTIAASGNLAFGAIVILDDSAGTMTLQNVDALDATTEATIEAAIDTLANLTSAAALATVGTIATGVWQGTAVADAYVAGAAGWDAKLDDITGEALSTLADVTITGIGANEILAWTGAAWINATLAEAGIAASTHTHTISDVTDWGTGVATALAVNVGSAGAFVVLNGALGTPSSGSLGNCTGYQQSNLTGFGTGVSAALASIAGNNGGIVVLENVLGSPGLPTIPINTPTQGVLTNCTGYEGTAVASTGEVGGTKFLREDGDGTCSWQTIAGGGDALTANPLSQFAATTSLQLAGVISDETGSGALVFATSPTLVTPALGTPASGTLTNCTGYPAASDTAAGVQENATIAETDTGTSTTRTVTPDGLAGSYAGSKSSSTWVIGATTDAATGDGAAYIIMPQNLDGMNLVTAHATVLTAGTTGTMDIQIHNVTQAADMLSTKITIDSAETSSRTAATPPVIDAANDDIAAGDVLRIDIDAIHTTPAQGLLVELEYRLP